VAAVFELATCGRTLGDGRLDYFPDTKVEVEAQDDIVADLMVNERIDVRELDIVSDSQMEQGVDAGREIDM